MKTHWSRQKELWPRHRDDVTVIFQEGGESFGILPIRLSAESSLSPPKNKRSAKSEAFEARREYSSNHRYKVTPF